MVQAVSTAMQYEQDRSAQNVVLFSFVPAEDFHKPFMTVPGMKKDYGCPMTSLVLGCTGTSWSCL